MSVVEVAPGTLVVETSVADGKVGVIAGGHSALAVDAGIDDAEGASVLAAARSFGRESVRLAYTHGHVDHALGGTAFRGLDILATPPIAAHMRAQIDEWAARTGEERDALAARMGWPTTMFDTGGEIDLGDRLVRFLDTPGHAPGAICIYDPDAGILFGGDTVVTAIPPYFKDGDSTALEGTLRALATLEIKVLVPGHGAVVHGQDETRRAILWEADYLARCREHVSAHLDGGVEDVIAGAPFDDFIGSHLPRDRHRMEWRHEQALRLMFAERTGGASSP